MRQTQPHSVRSMSQSRRNCGGASRRAQDRLSQVALPEALFDTVARVCTALQVDGHRADITMLKTARALAALDGRQEAAEGDLRQAAELALPHRLRRTPFEQGGGAELNWGELFHG